MKMGDLMNASLKALLNEQYKLVAELREENKKLKEKLDNRDLLLEGKRKEVQTLFKVNEELTAKNKKLKETIKDHQLYEEKLEHRIIELEELLHGE